MPRFLILCCLLLAIGTASAQREIPRADASRFGIVEGFWFPELTCELGVGWERIIFDWGQHQPNAPDDWHTLNVDDRWLKAADACDREIVALLKHTPAWATDGLPGVGLPRGLDLPHDDPDNLWGAFVHRAVDYYSSRGVNHYIIWNEPDIDAETYGYEFEGELEDYARLLQVAYQSAKAANPAAVIHLAGTTYWHDVNEGRRPYFERLVDYLLADPEAAAHGYYFDVLSLHIYFRTDTVYDIAAEMRDMLDSRGLTDKTIWINETNAAPTIDPVWPVERPVYDLDLEQQAQFVVQSAALALAAGVERVAVYKLYDQALPEGAESFGILSPPDATPRPAFAAWQTVVDLFSRTESARLARTETADIVHLIHQNRQQIIAAWARTGEATRIDITATAEKAYLIDVYGSIRVVRPVDGHFRLTLLPARCTDSDGCFIGGPVQILVQPQGAITVTENGQDSPAELEFSQER